MKHIIHTDADGYIIGLELTTSEQGVEVPTEVFESVALTCYKYENGEFIFDEEKEASIISRANNDMEIANLKDELSTYDYIGTKIAMGVATVEDYSEEIAYTETLRQRIRELK